MNYVMSNVEWKVKFDPESIYVSGWLFGSILRDQISSLSNLVTANDPSD